MQDQNRKRCTSCRLASMPSITNAGRVRGDFNATLHWRLIEGRNLWFDLTQAVNYDSRPPVNAPKTDYVTQSTLSWSFP